MSDQLKNQAASPKTDSSEVRKLRVHEDPLDSLQGAAFSDAGAPANSLDLICPGVDEMPGQIVGQHYEILSLIGTGGLGAVYKAHHKLLKKTVAIKFLRPGRQLESNALMRFQREAQAAVGLTHQNIAGVQEFGIHNEMPFLVMELVEGESLAQILKREGALRPVRAMKLLKQLLQALGYAHKKGVIHRDVKPENIIVIKPNSDNEEVKLIDFGIAKMIESEELLDITKTGEVFGTPYYMSPEQCRGMNVTPRTDIYSAGCVAYEMLSGAPPFTGDAPIKVILKHVNDSPQVLSTPENAAGLERVIDRALAKEANNRYSSAVEMLSELALIETGKAPRKTFHLNTKSLNKIIFGSIISVLALACSYALLVATLGQEKTIQSVSKDIREHPDRFSNYIDRSDLYAAEKNYPAAIADLATAAKLKPHAPIAYELKSKWETEAGFFEDAKKDADKAILLSPNTHFPYVHRARANFNLKNYQAVIADSAKAIELDPGNRAGWFYSCYLNSAHAQLMLGEYEKAIADADNALKYAPKVVSKPGTSAIDHNAIDAYNVKARANLRWEKFPEAAADADKALAIDPNAYYPLAMKANAYRGMKRYDEALLLIDEAIKLATETKHLRQDRKKIEEAKLKDLAPSTQSSSGR
ncbi:MAG: protein kinase [Candidatus Melainabacteria bacterium]|nr:protein kinase [Candidatus Melainabacteria bacterium]